MRIAQIAPLTESVSPKLYGGTERVVAWLTEELVRQGHDVTLFASGDSVTSAELVPCCRRALRLDPDVQDALPYHLGMIERVRRMADRFDVLHFHVDMVHFPVFRDRPSRCLTTLHGRLDLPDLKPFYRLFPDMPLVSISDNQRAPLPWACWVATVHHGLPPNAFRFVPRPEGYVAFLGRICPEKRPDRAIAIARAAGLPLKIAAKVDRVDVAYFEQRIRPLLDDPLIEFLGEIGEAEKNEFLGKARALLFPIDWPEPFGLVMIEAMGCGTPVVAFSGGSVAEVLEDGLTGFVVEDLEGAVRALDQVDRLDRRLIRQRFEERFHVEQMALRYIDAYRQSAPTPRVAA